MSVYFESDQFDETELDGYIFDDEYRHEMEQDRDMYLAYVEYEMDAADEWLAAQDVPDPYGWSDNPFGE